MIALIIPIAVIIGILSFYFAYSRFDLNKEVVPESYASEREEIPPDTGEEDKKEETSPVMSEEKITGSTKMVYQYYYPADGNIVEQEDVPPYFLIGMTFSDMKDYYSNWQIVYFSEDKVVMRKEVVLDTDENYMVGNMDGYVAVYYDNGDYGMSLKTVTDTPLSSLDEEERKRLDEGIFISGDEELARVLESYES